VVGERESVDAATLDPDVDLLVWELGSTEADSLSRVTEVAKVVETLCLVGSEAGVSALLRAGAKGVLFRDTDGERLRRACLTVLTGATVLDEGMLDLLLERHPSEPQPAGELTPRELEVLALMAEGLSNKLIGARLRISEHTAKFHVNAVLDKLAAETRTEAVVTAVRRGFLML